jgi:regulator of extracellular matrix RemA (YlzA/DUF370 family)
LYDFPNRPRQEVEINAVTPVVLNVGFYNFVASDKILALIRSDSAPMRRVVQEARKSGNLVDATQGRKTKSVLFLVGGATVASALSQETLARRLGGWEPQPLAGGAEEAAAAAREEDESELSD